MRTGCGSWQRFGLDGRSAEAVGLISGAVVCCGVAREDEVNTGRARCMLCRCSVDCGKLQRRATAVAKESVGSSATAALAFGGFAEPRSSAALLACCLASAVSRLDSTEARMVRLVERATQLPEGPGIVFIERPALRLPNWQAFVIGR